MNEKRKLPIILPVLVGILVVTIFIARKENTHNIPPDIEDNTVLENDLSEIHKIEEVIKKSGNQKSDEFQNLDEAGSPVDWVNQIDDMVSGQVLDAGSKVKKILIWLREDNVPGEVRVKLYRALVQLKSTDYIEEIFSLVGKENNLDIKLAGIEALALTGRRLLASGRAEGQIIINLLKNFGQQTQDPAIGKKLNSLVAYMEDVLAGNKNELVEIEYLTSRDAYIWDLSAKLEDRSNLKHGLARLLDDVSVFVDQDKKLLNEEYKKLNLAYLDYFSNGFSGDVPDHQDTDYFFEEIKPRKIETLTEDAVSRYRIWFTAWSYSIERGSNDYNDFIINELKKTDSPVAALVFIENGLNVIDQLDPSTREKLVSLLEEDGVTTQGSLSEEVAEALDFLV